MARQKADHKAKLRSITANLWVDDEPCLDAVDESGRRITVSLVSMYGEPTTDGTIARIRDIAYNLRELADRLEAGGYARTALTRKLEGSE